jgi:hypothetical protein
VAEAQAVCCQLHAANGTCDGFSFARQAAGADGRSTGCLKKNLNAGTVGNQGYDGYALPGPAPGGGGCRAAPASALDPEGARSAVLGTVHSAPGRMAVVVIASWCTAAAEVTLRLDWAALGLDEATAVVDTPAIAGVQRAGAPLSAAKLASTPFALAKSGGGGGVQEDGRVLVVRPAAAPA